MTTHQFNGILRINCKKIYNQNMKLKFTILGMFAATLALFSCSSTSKRTFTQSFYKNSNLSPSDLKSVQFYLSDDIVLYRKKDMNTTNIKDGKIIIKGKEQFEEIRIQRGTKGVAIYQPKDDRIGISFVPNNDELYLMFGPNPKMNNSYCLLASDWNNQYGIISYGGEKWQTPISSAYTTLLIELDKSGKKSYKTATAKGRTIAH